MQATMMEIIESIADDVNDTIRIEYNLGGSFTENEVDFYVDYFDKNKAHFNIEKFVPASGAATRMFKFLNEFLNEFDIENDTINSYINKHKAKDVSLFIFGIRNFPFYKLVKEKTIQLYPDYYSQSSDTKYYLLIKTLLSSEGLNFANQPKGIIPFHLKEEKFFTPVEENIIEEGLNGAKNIISSLGMRNYKYDISKDRTPILLSKSKWLRSPISGMFHIFINNGCLSF